MSFEVSADAYGRMMGRYSAPPLTLGVGPVGDYVQSLAEEPRTRLREQLRKLAGSQPVEISATAWTVTCRI